MELGALIVWRYSIQGLGYSTLAMSAGVGEMAARTAVALWLVPPMGYFGAELANPAAWVAACLVLWPAYRWTLGQLEQRLLAGRLNMRSAQEVRQLFCANGLPSGEKHSIMGTFHRGKEL